MTDTSARDALAAALHIVAWSGATYEDEAVAILAHPYTKAERRALAAAFLDAETLAVALNDAQVLPPEIAWGHDLTVPARRILAALRETP